MLFSARAEVIVWWVGVEGCCVFSFCWDLFSFSFFKLFFLSQVETLNYNQKKKKKRKEKKVVPLFLLSEQPLAGQDGDDANDHIVHVLGADALGQRHQQADHGQRPQPDVGLVALQQEPRKDG
jgi:hypothetical protein